MNNKQKTVFLLQLEVAQLCVRRAQLRAELEGIEMDMLGATEELRLLEGVENTAAFLDFAESVAEIAQEQHPMFSRESLRHILSDMQAGDGAVTGEGEGEEEDDAPSEPISLPPLPSDPARLFFCVECMKSLSYAETIFVERTPFCGAHAPIVEK
jgi:hypothetical protein